MKYDVIIIGAGPGGIFSAYELVKGNKDLKIAVFETGSLLEKRNCPIDGEKVKSCVNCKTCAPVVQTAQTSYPFCCKIRFICVPLSIFGNTMITFMTVTHAISYINIDQFPTWLPESDTVSIQLFWHSDIFC